MTLTLRIRNVDRLDNGMPAEFVLNRRGAVIGRAATCDWCLPDPRNYISSRHAEVLYRDGFYQFTDLSTNGTFLNGGGERMAAPRRVEQGDRFLIGQYEVVAALSGEALATVERHGEAVARESQRQAGWGWDTAGGAAPVPPAPGGWDDAPANSGLSGGVGGSAAPLGSGWDSPGADAGWGTPPPSGAGWATPSPDDGWGSPPNTPGQPAWAPQLGPSLSKPAPYAQGGAAPAASPAPTDSNNSWAPAPRAPEQRAPSPWDSAQPPAQPSSPWSSAAPDRPRAATPNDIWGSMENSNVVDWARANFGAKPEPAGDPLGLEKRPTDALPRELPRAPGPPPDAGWSQPAPAPPPPAPAAAPAQPALAFMQAAGLEPGQVKSSAETLTRAGQLMRRLVAGLVVMVEARARAKSQMGAERTGLEFDGNNPIKFARAPEQALAALLNLPERGFMPAEQAIEDAFFDLQSHQMATLKAMQGALRATLDRFSPDAIRKRAELGGFLNRLLPGGREATLWHTYEREFSGVAQGSDEAFMDVFAKEFRQAYEAQSRSRRRG